MKTRKMYIAIAALASLIMACSLVSRTAEIPSTPTRLAEPSKTPRPTPTVEVEVIEEEESETEEPIDVSFPPAEEPVQLIGQVEITNFGIFERYFFERFVMLEDLTGFVDRDFEYEPSLEGQILGPIVVSEEGEITFTLNLPARPIDPFNDVDQDSETDQGVQIWQVVMNANYHDDPFLSEGETRGWSANFTSARIDSENKREIIGGTILVWAPDDQQEFPSGFGEDGLLFTKDDPVDAIPAGYSIVNLEDEPFEVDKEPVVSMSLYEGEIQVNDFSELGWAEAFEAMHNKISVEYPFTEMKAIDWDALYEEFAPKIETAEAEKDETAYYLALRDYSWSIPDGHVSVSSGDIGSQMFEEETAGGYGLAVIGLSDGRVLAHIVLEDGPAAKAGIEWGAEIQTWDGEPIAEAVEAVVPWSMPFSTEESLRIQQYRYLTRAPLGTEAEVTFQNPAAEASTTITMTAVAERDTFSATSIYAGYDFTGLPIEYEILPSGYGYIILRSFSDDINLTVRLWEWAIERMIAAEVPALIIDLRQNSGGTPFGSYLASFFIEERFDIGRSYYYSEKTGQFETYGPPDYAEPDDDLYYGGQLGVLVGPACASACEDTANVLSLLPQTRVFGYYATNGVYGEVARGNYLLPEGYSFRAPTGMDKDMDGNIIIEGVGVVPDIRVPLTEETVRAQYVDGKDVILEFTVETINQPLGAGITPEHSPTIGTQAESEAALQAQTKFLEEMAQGSGLEEAKSLAGEVYTLTVPMNTSKDAIWNYAWCTADEDSFSDNWSKIELEFSLNGEIVPLEAFAVLEGEFSGNHCRVYYTVLSDWAVGEHILTTEVTFTAPLNDGLEEEDFPAGTHIYEYHVYIGR